MPSDNTKTWLHGLLRHNIGRYCLLFLSFMCFLALIAYWVIPDDTSNANRQIPEVALMFPGQTQQFLVVPRKIDRPKKNYINRTISGRNDDMEFIPFDSLVINERSARSQFKGIYRSHEDVKQSVVKTKKVRFYMGSDKYGRDVLSRLILGLRISLFIGFLSVLVSIILGLLIGCTGGYFGGRVDQIITLIINTGWSIPTLLMSFAIILAFGKGLSVIILAIGLTMWVDIARIVRGQTLQLKTELFVKASKTLGFNSLRTIVKHILPNLVGIILVISSANFATAILIEAGLSFLGMGVQPPVPSLGNMLQESYAYATGGFVYLAIFPILTIMSLVLSFNLLGTALRDIVDVKSLAK